MMLHLRGQLGAVVRVVESPQLSQARLDGAQAQVEALSDLCVGVAPDKTKQDPLVGFVYR